MSVYRRIQAFVLNLMFYPLMALWIVAGILASPFCLVIWKVVTGWDIGRIVRHLINIHGYGVVVIVSPLVRFQGEGLTDIERPCIMVVNHLSFFDSYFISTLPFHDIIFAVGAWPFKMYWYTVFMRLARYLDVETDDWSEVMRTCTETFAKKGTVLFFPEGHRSRTGLSSGHFFLHPARVRLKALDPVDPSAFLGKRGLAKLRREVRERMARELAKMQGKS